MSLRDNFGVFGMGLKMMGAAFGKAPNQALRQMASKIFQPRWSEPPARNSAAWIDLYMKSPRMNPIHKIATDVASSNYKLFVKNADPKQQIKQHISLELLENPCPMPEFTGFHLFYLTEVYRLLPSGEAFWLIERNGLGVPIEIWLIPPHWVMDTPTQTQPYFRVQPQGNVSYTNIYVEPKDMIWFKEPNPLNPYGRGRGRSEAIGDELETDEYMAKFQKKYFYNDATPPVVFTAPGADEAGINRLQEDWMSKYSGYNNAHKPAILNWDAKVQILKETQKEMDFVESRKYLRDATNQFWSIPPELFGILENSNRSTIDAAYYIYTKNILSQRLKSFDASLNKQFFPQFDKRIIIEHDNVVPEDKEFELKKHTEGLKYGAVMVDEWRHNQDMPNLDGSKGRMLYVPLNMIPYPISDDIEGLPNQEPNEPTKGYKALTEARKKAMWKNFDNAAVKYEKKLEKELKKYFQAQQTAINNYLAKSITAIETKEITDNPDELLNWDEEATKLLELVTPIYLVAAEEGAKVAAELLNIELDFSIIQPKMLTWINENGLTRAKGINETTQEVLRKTLAEGIEAGESLAKLRDRVSSEYSTIKSSRALLIARQETMTTVNVGNFETMQEAGVEKIMWLSSRDERVRDTHKKLDGEVVDIGQPFSNGLLHPHGEGDAKEVIRCRCTIIMSE